MADDDHDYENELVRDAGHIGEYREDDDDSEEEEEDEYEEEVDHELVQNVGHIGEYTEDDDDSEEEEEDEEEEEEEDDHEYENELVQDAGHIEEYREDDDDNEEKEVEEESKEESPESQWNRSEIDGSCCSICMEAWTIEGDHHISCLPCGHIFGLSCINRWIKQQGRLARCPQCNRKSTMKDIIKLFAPWIGVIDEESQKGIQYLEAKCASLETELSNWYEKESEWEKKQVVWNQRIQYLQTKCASHERELSNWCEKESEWDKKQVEWNQVIKEIKERKLEWKQVAKEVIENKRLDESRNDVDIWKSCNDVVWKGKRSDARGDVAIWSGLSSAWEEGQNSVSNVQSSGMGVGAEKWQKPNKGWLKINVDAAVFQDKGAVGAVMRNDWGRFVGGFVVPVMHQTDSLLLEIRAIWEALSWVKGRGRRNVVIESDCLVAVQAINACPDLCFVFSPIVQDCITLLATLDCVRVEYVRRSANCAAHCLVTEAHSYASRFVWGFSPPTSIVAALAEDLVE